MTTTTANVHTHYATINDDACPHTALYRKRVEQGQPARCGGCGKVTP